MTTDLSPRQEQLYDELREAARRGEPTTATHLARLMYVHRGVGKSQTYDLLGALQKKGAVTLRGKEWHSEQWGDTTHNSVDDAPISRKAE